MKIQLDGYEIVEAITLHLKEKHGIDAGLPFEVNMKVRETQTVYKRKADGTIKRYKGNPVVDHTSNKEYLHLHIEDSTSIDLYFEGTR